MSDQQAKEAGLTKAQIRYLTAVQDWKAPYEIAALLGWRTSAGEEVKPFLGRLIGAGLVTWSSANNTYKITDAGRAALAKDTENGK